MFHSKRRQTNSEELAIYLDNVQLLHVSCYKYLGVLFETDMHWKNQIKNISTKLAHGCYTLLKAREFFNSSILRILYFAFVHSHLNYCIESWGGTYTTYLEPLSRLQKRAMRLITYSRYTEPSGPLFRSVGVLPLDLLYNLKIAETVFKIIKTNDPLPLQIFKLPLRNTRAATNNLFNLPSCRNVYGERLIEFNGALVWNDIPTDIKCKPNILPSLTKYLIKLRANE